MSSVSELWAHQVSNTSVANCRMLFIMNCSFITSLRTELLNREQSESFNRETNGIFSGKIIYSLQFN